MDNLNHLKDLLVFDVQHLYSAEEQIIDALPAMIGKASHPQGGICSSLFLLCTSVMG